MHSYCYTTLFICTFFDAECTPGKVRLVGEDTNSSSGLLEVCINGRWGRVCDYRMEWNHKNTEVVCRQLNLPSLS